MGKLLFLLCKCMHTILSEDEGVWKSLCRARFGSGFDSLPPSIVAAKGGYAGMYVEFARGDVVRDPLLERREYSIPKPAITPSDVSFFIQLKAGDEIILSEKFSGTDFGALFKDGFVPIIHCTGYEFNVEEYDYIEYRHPRETQNGEARIKLTSPLRLSKGKTITEATLYLLCEKNSTCIRVLHYPDESTHRYQINQVSKGNVEGIEDCGLEEVKHYPFKKQVIQRGADRGWSLDESEFWGKVSRIGFGLGEPPTFFRSHGSSRLKGIFLSLDLNVSDRHEDDGKSYVPESVTHITLQCSVMEQHKE